jgi:hypothetical protein
VSRAQAVGAATTSMEGKDKVEEKRKKKREKGKEKRKKI